MKTKNIVKNILKILPVTMILLFTITGVTVNATIFTSEPQYFPNFTGSTHSAIGCHNGVITVSSADVQITSLSGTAVNGSTTFNVTVRVINFTVAANHEVIVGFPTARGDNAHFSFNSIQQNDTLNSTGGTTAPLTFIVTAPSSRGNFALEVDAIYTASMTSKLNWAYGLLAFNVTSAGPVTPPAPVNPWGYIIGIAAIAVVALLIFYQNRVIANRRREILSQDVLMDRKELNVKLKEYAGDDVIKDCSNCTMCRDECPTYYSRKAESYYAGGRLRVLRAYVEKKYPIDDDFIEAMYYCTTCKQCEDRCPVPVKYVDIIEGLRSKLVQHKVGPYGKQLGLSRNTYLTKNPYGDKPECRADWCMEGESVAEDIKTVERGPIAYFVGCTASFRTKSAAQNTARILSKLNPGGIVILGSGEYCCGSPLIRTGQDDFDLKLADGKEVRFRVKDLITHNIESMIMKDVKEVVFSCSGCYKTSLDDWPRYYEKELPFKRTHITEYLARKIEEGAITLKPLEKTITYHDPCHLGRHRKVYDAPRNVINAIPGVNFVEMQFNRNRARCCGAGAGVKSGYPVDAVNMAKIRLQEAVDTGADILATSCVFCKYNFLDAKKEMDTNIEILNIEDLVIDLIEPVVTS